MSIPSFINSVLRKITPADPAVRREAGRKLDCLIKPPGSLGRLEECAMQFTAARGDIHAQVLHPAIVTFAGDHGIAQEGVSAADQSVTALMVRCMNQGGAGINVLTRFEGIRHLVVDVGMAEPSPWRNVLSRHIADGTKNFTRGPAMTREQCEKAFSAGMEMACELEAQGSTLVGTGEMGIGNTTSAAALYCALLGVTPEAVCGCGTGVSRAVIQKKIAVVRQGLAVNSRLLAQGPFEIMQCVGGFEIAAMTGMILQAAACRIPVLIDGVISSAAAADAIRMKPEIRDYCFFSHLSGDSGHGEALKVLGVRPLLDLGMRLGEGTGAALACNLVQASVKLLNEMMSLADAGIQLHGEE